MRKFINTFVKIAAQNLRLLEPVYEFGSYQVAGQEEISNLSQYFPGMKYVGADARQGPGVDVILDLQKIDLPNASVGTVLMLDTLEHVEHPELALREIYRILKPDGVLIMSSVMNFHIHDYPSDYWRFTPEAFRSLLKPFAASVVEAGGLSDFPHSVVGIGFKGTKPERECAKLLEELKKQKTLSGGWRERVTDLSPPIVMHVYRKLKAMLKP